MEFSPVVPCSNGLVQWSPNGRFIAHAVQTRLVIRESASLKVLSSHCCLDAIDQLSWSPSSEFVAAVVPSLAVTHVHSPISSDWSAKITEGTVGLDRVRFSPDSRHIISTSALGLKLTIWSLCSKQVRFIKCPKCHDFSSDGSLLAVAEKSPSGKEAVGIYECDNWQEVGRFDTECPDVVGLSWCPQDMDKLVVWNGCLQYLMQIFTTRGRCLMSFAPYRLGLGIKTLSWSPCGQIIAVGSYDEKVRLVNALNYTEIADLPHPSTIDDDSLVTRSCSVFEEKEVHTDDIDAKIVQEWLNSKDTVYESVETRPANLHRVKPDPKKPNPKLGVGTIRFSPDGLLLATKEDSLPSTVWIWNVQNLTLSTVLVQRDPVSSFEWEPNSSRLVVATGGTTVYLWSALGVVTVRLPLAGEVRASKVVWNPLGKTMVLAAKEGFVCSKIVKKRS